MSIITRILKGFPLTWIEVDQNFTQLDTLKAPKESPTFTGIVSGITKLMIGLGNAEDKSSATIRSEITSVNVTSAIGFTPLNPNNNLSDVNDTSTAKSNLLLGNVENKSSATIRSEITSNNVTTALGFTPLDTAKRGLANGVASLDSSGLVPASQLPSYVDDVLEYANFAALPAIGESGKIYVLDTSYTINDKTSDQFRWAGSAYAPIIASPGTTDAVIEGSTNLYFTIARVRSAISVSGNLSYNPTTGVITYTAPTYSSVASTGSYTDLTNKPTIPTVPTVVSAFSNDSGYLTGISSTQVITALGYTPLKPANNLSEVAIPSIAATNLGLGTGSNVTFATVSDSNGNVRKVPQSGAAKTASYTLATTDVGQFIQLGTSGSITIPNSTFSAGDIVSLFNNTSGSITVTCSTTNAYIAGTDTNKTSVALATRGVATILFITSTLCVISGNVS